jgi:putative ABC transport system ATP-binding protein
VRPRDLNDPAADPRALIRLQNLSHDYREGDKTRRILHELSANLPPGQCIALLGQSGSGKSTLLNLIAGLDTPTAGEISINDVNLTRLSERERTLFRRRHIGFVYQFFNLIPTLTVRENVLLPLDLNRIMEPSARDAALALLQEVGLADRVDSYPDRLSGGEQQRAAVVRALVHDPLLILADEPTGNLDRETGRQILGLLDRLIRQRGKTLVVVTHSLDVASSADRVLWLQDGRLYERPANMTRP